MSMPESRTIPLLIKEQARRFASNEALIDGTRPIPMRSFLMKPTAWRAGSLRLA